MPKSLNVLEKARQWTKLQYQFRFSLQHRCLEKSTHWYICHCQLLIDCSLMDCVVLVQQYIPVSCYWISENIGSKTLWETQPFRTLCIVNKEPSHKTLSRLIHMHKATYGTGWMGQVYRKWTWEWEHLWEREREESERRSKVHIKSSLNEKGPTDRVYSSFLL